MISPGQNPESVIGVHISAGFIRAAEIERNGARSTLRAVQTWPAHFPASIHDEMAPESAALELKEALQEFASRHQTIARTASVTLDTEQLLLAEIPLARGLSAEATNERIAWEISQFFPNSTANDFITNLHVIARSASGDVDESLLVAVRRRMGIAIERAIRSAGFSVAIVDVDHFSLEIALRLNHPDLYAKYIALVGIKQHRLDFTVLRNGVLESYTYHMINAPEQILPSLLQLQSISPNITTIVLAGENADSPMVQDLRQSLPLPVEVLDPVHRIGIDPRITPEEQLASPPYLFSAAIGVALRRD